MKLLKKEKDKMLLSLALTRAKRKHKKLTECERDFQPRDIYSYIFIYFIQFLFIFYF